MPSLLIFLVLLGLHAYGSELKTNEQVIFFPSIARAVSNGWEIEIHGCVFELERRPILGPLFRHALGIDTDNLSTVEQAILRERTQYFLEDNKRRKMLAILLGGATNQVGPSTANGHFSTRLHVASDLMQQLKQSAGAAKAIIPFEVLAHQQRAIGGSSAIHVLDETGISVISDIDDTIKISSVLDKKELLRNTFYRPFQPVPGMAAVYQSWAQSADARFHYISAMPWQLYLPISEFTRSNGFPAGTFHCRYLRLKDSSLWNLFQSPEQYKRETIDTLMRQFPKRRFVLVGDSGEKDPEVYGALARQYPLQVVHIFIRDVTGETTEAPRYREAFMGLPKELWSVFKDVKEIGTATALSPLKSTAN